MPEQLSLEGISEGSGILRAVRPQAGGGGVLAPDNDQSVQSPFSLVLRVYTPTNQPGTQLTLQTPAFQTRTPAKAALVTAPELPLSQLAFGSPLPASPRMARTVSRSALTSVQIVGMRRYVQPSNGK
jgi:hypothetical protein